MKKALVALSLAALASTAMAAIQNGPHDLSAGSINSSKYPGGLLSSCQYCHAAHHSNTTVAGVPLWNRVASPAFAATFTPYTSNTVSSSNPPGANSMTCLSCHDGVTDMGATYTGTKGFAAATPMIAGTTGNTQAVIGKDLTSSHPVGIRYVPSSTFNAVASVLGAGIRLYGATQTVECGSCHDPHGNDYDFLPGGASLLRVAETALCSTCHNK
ncbi:MAG TPA: cytochrome c3 family protein [Anaeromyxobacter sp.]|nr:cytochrome c3 family protein [Anaeromyxobacter sp.]